jgi:pyruvate kinase
MACKEMIQYVHKHSKLCCIESDMLLSMNLNPTPTRAEVSDIANSVIDGVDAVFLPEDLSKGLYPEKAFQLCKRIICDVEQSAAVSQNWQKDELKIESEEDAISYHAYQTALRVGAKALVCITKSSNTVRKLASYMPKVPIVAVTFSIHVARKLALIRGVSTLVLENHPGIDSVLPVVNQSLREYSWLKSGSKVVFVTVTLSSLSENASNLFSVQTIH